MLGLVLKASAAERLSATATSQLTFFRRESTIKKIVEWWFTSSSGFFKWIGANVMLARQS